MKTQKTQGKGVILLLLTAFIWGTAFVAQSVGSENLGCFTFNGIRIWMAAGVLLPVVLVRDWLRLRHAPEQRESLRKENRQLLRSGGLVGLVFFVASSLQQFAFPYSSAGKIAFITALYMFFVPLLGLLVGKRIPAVTWGCVIFGFIGLYFLTVNPADLGSINRGDLLSLGCSLFYAMHILLIERFAAETDGIKLSCMQCIVAGSISLVMMFLTEQPQWSMIQQALLPLLYAGVLSGGVAYTLQIEGQKYTESTVASLLMCTESVFGVVAAAVVLHETLNGREILGCGIMFGAILLSQLAEGRRSKKLSDENNNDEGVTT